MQLDIKSVKNFSFCPKYYQYAHIHKEPVPIALSTYSRKLLKTLLLGYFRGKLIDKDITPHDVNTSWAEHFYKDPSSCKYSISDEKTDQFNLGISYIQIFFNQVKPRGFTGKIIKTDDEIFVNVGEDVFYGTVDVIRDIQRPRGRVREILYVNPFKKRGNHLDLEILGQAYLYIKKYKTYGIHISSYDMVKGKTDKYFKSKEEVQIFEEILLNALGLIFF